MRDTEWRDDEGKVHLQTMHEAGIPKGLRLFWWRESSPRVVRATRPSGHVLAEISSRAEFHRDVLEWLEENGATASLDQIKNMQKELESASAQCRRELACEPRRSAGIQRKTFP